ncbi:MAG: WalW protein [Acidobacteria bacterium]|nr:WalW protein [Acidobacteriota bacterium]
MRNQALAQEIFDRFKVKPIYLVDYAVATQSEGYLPLRAILETGCCEIGAHLHPWITPPFAEELSNRTSFSHNLPAPLQKEKLACLTDAIVSSFGIRPVCYRAGRYGVGEEAADVLESLGYVVDMSVQPAIDMGRIDGPDFRLTPNRPYWFGRGGSLLEIPATPGFTGMFTLPPLSESLSVWLYDRLSRPALSKVRAPGVFARSRVLERIPMTPEGVSLTELRRLTQKLLNRERRVFVLSYHSSSLLPGNTEYVRSADDLGRFLATLAAYLQFFSEELSGTFMTPTELRSALSSPINGTAA